MKGTIKSKQSVERLFQQGRRSSSSCMTVLVMVNPEQEAGRTCFIAGKKLGCAPLRSRCKRVLRQVARELHAPWKGYDVAFIARARVARESHDEVVRQMRSNLHKLGVL